MQLSKKINIKKFSLLFIFLPFLLNSQVKNGRNKNFNSEDSTTLASIASYPDSTRKHALEACLHPEILIKTETLQKKSSESFRSLINDYGKDEQAKFWDLARYPGLIDKISTGEKKSKDELETIASGYPKEIKKTIIEHGRKNYSALSEINNLNVATRSEFEKIIAPYSENIKKSYRSLSVYRPDALSELADNMHLAVTLGDMYKSDPQQTLQMLNDLSEKQKEQKAKETEEWKKGLENDPVAKKEMEKAAREFSNETNYDDEEDEVYSTGGEGGLTPKKQVVIETPEINYVVQPYPYWFGYPSWYDYPYWYPYPYWYHTGYYRGPSGAVFFGLPSPYFMHWYFYHPYHHYYYPHFSDYSLSHSSRHYGPRNQSTGFNSVVNNWSRSNQANLPRGYFNQDAKRPQRIKELGKFEMDYYNNTKGTFGRNPSRSQFLKNNPGYYPQLKPAMRERNFNQPIKYPRQQNQQKFKMNPPANSPRSNPLSNPPAQPSHRNNEGGMKKAPR